MPQGRSAQDKVTMRGKQANGANGQGRRINTKVVLTLEGKKMCQPSLDLTRSVAFSSLASGIRARSLARNS